MKAMRRFVVASLLAIAMALPGIGGDGGPNGGGTGVWVLPAASFLSASPATNARDTHVSVSTSEALRFKVSDEVGDVVALFIDELSGIPVALPVNGREVTIPVAVLGAMAQSVGARADIVIVDPTLRGYVIKVAIAADRTAVVRVY
jgi:hypothetical protein